MGARWTGPDTMTMCRTDRGRFLVSVTLEVLVQTADRRPDAALCVSGSASGPKESTLP
jgi:hypothetical protein